MSDNAAAYAAASQAMNTAGQIIATGKINRATAKWNEKMYGIQRADALADWNMQNQYNSPQAQMARFRDAGLNPNLIYGQSNESGVVRSTDTKSWNPQVPQTDLGSITDKYFNTQMKEAQINNLKAQNDNIIAQKDLIQAQTQGVYKSIENQDSQIGYRGWDLENKKSLAPGNLEIQDWKIRDQMKSLDIKGQIHEQNLMKNAQSIEKGGIDIINARIDTSLKHLQERYMEGSINKQTYETELTKTKMLGEVIQQKYIEALKENVNTRTHFMGSENDMRVIQTGLQAINALFGYYRLPK